MILFRSRVLTRQQSDRSKRSESSTVGALTLIASTLMTERTSNPIPTVIHADIWLSGHRASASNELIHFNAPMIAPLLAAQRSPGPRNLVSPPISVVIFFELQCMNNIKQHNLVVSIRMQRESFTQRHMVSCLPYHEVKTLQSFVRHAYHALAD